MRPFHFGLLALSLFMSNTVAAVEPLDYKIQLDVVSDGYDGKFCWMHPYAGTIPGETPTVVLTKQKLLLGHSDAFFPIHSQFSTDLGKTWSPLVEHKETLGRTQRSDGLIEGICDFVPKWHEASKQLIGTGHTVLYTPDNKIVVNQRRYPVWSVYDAKAQSWSKWSILKLPDEPLFWTAHAGCTQRLDLKNGDILLPIYSRAETSKAYSTSIVRCRFENGELRYIERGNTLTVPIDRGLYESSLTHFNGKFYLTLRNDRAAYHAVSEDGLRYSEPKKWTFDDGQALGSYNTQAHWITHSKGLFLSYTRKGANNDHVFRHRAPLFIAQVDTERMTVLRASERILVPEKGAQLGNFGVVNVNESETWVTTSEGMTHDAPQNHGSNGRVYAARLLWNQPNKNWNQLLE
jgi:hypothetical protein